MKHLPFCIPVSIRGGRVTGFESEAYLRFFDSIIRDREHFDGDYHYNLHDYWDAGRAPDFNYECPVLSGSASQTDGATPFADTHFVDGGSLNGEVIRPSSPSTKIQKLVWRGSLWPVPPPTETPSDPRRVELVERFCDVPWADVADTYAHADRKMTVTQMAAYAIQLDVDGFSNSWFGTRWKLASGSVVIKLAGRYRQWYYHRLIPGVHYVQIHSMDELPGVVQRCLDHPGEADRIGQAGRAFFEEHLTEAAVYAEMHRILMANARLAA